MRDDIMFQEAVFDCINAIDEATLFSEYEVLHSLGETYIKSALIMEAAVDDNAAGDGNPTDLPDGATVQTKEKWYKRAIRWLIDAFKLIWKKIKAFFKNLPKNTASLVDGIYANAKGITRVTVKGDTVTVKLDYSPDAVYAVFTKILNLYDNSNDASVEVPSLKAVTKKTSIEYEEYKKKLDGICDVLEQLITTLQRKQASAGIDFSKFNSDDLKKINDILEVTNKVNNIVTANNMEIKEILAKKEADKNTMSKKEMKQVRDVL